MMDVVFRIRWILLGWGLFVLAGCKAQTNDAASTKPTPSSSASTKTAEPKSSLRIAYSDWPGWVAWDIAIEKKYFAEAGVDVALVWLDYVPSIETFSAGKVDAVCMTNGDALVAGSSGAASTGILINDYSDGNDMIVARSGIDKVADLKGKKIGVEVGFVDHLLLMEALKSVGLVESDVTVVNTKTPETPALLKSGKVDAIAAWQPNSGQALDDVQGSKPLFTSADTPGLIYDLLFVTRKSLQERRADWVKVVKVWFRVAEFVNAPATRQEAAKIMAARVKLSPEKYEKLMSGTHFLGAADNQKRYDKTPGFQSVHGSTEIVDRFNVANKVYKDPATIDPYFDASLVRDALAK
jgi:NitT/TauT family transport system substrate-binding protein